MPTSSRLAFKIAGIKEEEINEWSGWTDEVIDQKLAFLQQKLIDIEFKKKLNRSAWENREHRQFETEDASMLKVASNNEKKVIDRVPPKVRLDILNGVYAA